jgi:hypothetical protein
MIEHVALPVIIMAAGLFSAVCAIREVEWFMKHRKAQRMASIVGYAGMRFFYTALGSILFVSGALMLAAGLQKL